MKKKLLAVLFPVVFIITCSLAVWANGPAADQPACDKCPKAEKVAPSAKQTQDSKAAEHCDLNAKAGGKAPCEKCAADQAAAKGCDKCPKMAAETKPCCDKEGAKAAQAKPCAMKGCDHCPKKQAAAAEKPCCDKGKPE